MENRNSYFIVGLFFCLVVGFMGVFLLFMQGHKNNDMRDYYIVTKELPNGIKKDSEVRFIGVPAGYVKDIYFSNPSLATIEIWLRVDDDLPIKIDSKAIVERSGISGIAHINITKGSDEARVFDKKERAELMIGEGLLDKIGSKTANLTDSLDRIANKIDMSLKQENMDKLVNSIDRLNSLMSVVASYENLEKIDNIISNINGITSDLNEANLQNVILNLDKTINSVGETWADSISQLNDLLIQIKNNLNNLEDNPYEFFFKNRDDK